MDCGSAPGSLLHRGQRSNLSDGISECQQCRDRLHFLYIRPAIATSSYVDAQRIERLRRRTLPHRLPARLSRPHLRPCARKRLVNTSPPDRHCLRTECHQFLILNRRFRQVPGWSSSRRSGRCSGGSAHLSGHLGLASSPMAAASRKAPFAASI
ncbi:hypothetical protein BV20DRAFT_374158 [Pilatotrama ljubarskyi]|nr:hypothetical protein BV20DRAFT_374158 [Pilatotrama ljubarskyi]